MSAAALRMHLQLEEGRLRAAARAEVQAARAHYSVHTHTYALCSPTLTYRALP